MIRKKSKGNIVFKDEDIQKIRNNIKDQDEVIKEHHDKRNLIYGRRLF